MRYTVVECAHCNATGYDNNDEPCDQCEGTGEKIVPVVDDLDPDEFHGGQ